MKSTTPASARWEDRRIDFDDFLARAKHKKARLLVDKTRALGFLSSGIVGSLCPSLRPWTYAIMVVNTIWWACAVTATVCLFTGHWWAVFWVLAGMIAESRTLVALTCCKVAHLAANDRATYETLQELNFVIVQVLAGDESGPATRPEWGELTKHGQTSEFGGEEATLKVRQKDNNPQV